MTDNFKFNEVIDTYIIRQLMINKTVLTRSISATFSLLASSSRLMAAACSSVESSCNTTRGDQLLNTWRSAVGHEAARCWTRGDKLLDTRQPAVFLDTRHPAVGHETASCWTRGSQLLDTRKPAVGHVAISR
jgi:hypothetical protein